MKCYKDSYRYRLDDEKHRNQSRQQEFVAGGFKCSHCKRFVVVNDIMGTANRNHCNICLWSKHVDEQKGDRRAMCQAGMKPVGLTLKHEGIGKIGEIMLIHLCSGCPKISINRIARDDPECGILELYSDSLNLDVVAKQQIEQADIYLLGKDDHQQVTIQLFGMRG